MAFRTTVLYTHVVNNLKLKLLCHRAVTVSCRVLRVRVATSSSCRIAGLSRCQKVVLFVAKMLVVLLKCVVQAVPLFSAYSHDHISPSCICLLLLDTLHRCTSNSASVSNQDCKIILIYLINTSR